MGKLIKMLFGLCFNTKSFSRTYESKKHGFYGIMFRCLEWENVERKLSQIETMLEPLEGDWSAKINYKGDVYLDKGVQKKVQETCLWVSKDLRENQTVEGIMANIPVDLQ